MNKKVTQQILIKITEPRLFSFMDYLQFFLIFSIIGIRPKKFRSSLRSFLFIVIYNKFYKIFSTYRLDMVYFQKHYVLANQFLT